MGIPERKKLSDVIYWSNNAKIFSWENVNTRTDLIKNTE